MKLIESSYADTSTLPERCTSQTSTTARLPPPTLRTLSLLQIHFLLTFPFEALSLNYEPSGIMSPSLPHIFARFITNRHGGGYCLQVNLLYRELLAFLDFRFIGVLGRVAPSAAVDWSGFTHTATLVYLDSHVGAGKAYYLTDVGFGSSPHRPILLSDGWEEFGRGTDRFRVVKSPFQPSSTLEPDPETDQAAVDDGGVATGQTSWILQNHKNGDWSNCYSFSTFQCFTPDFFAANRATSHHESVPFAVMILVVRYLLSPEFSPDKSAELVERDGLNKELHPYHPSLLEQRMVVGDKFFVRVGDEERVNRVIETEEERVELLKSQFGLLGHVSTEEALRTIAGKPSRLHKE